MTTATATAHKKDTALKDLYDLCVCLSIFTPIPTTQFSLSIYLRLHIPLLFGQGYKSGPTMAHRLFSPSLSPTHNVTPFDRIPLTVQFSSNGLTEQTQYYVIDHSIRKSLVSNSKYLPFAGCVIHAIHGRVNTHTHRVLLYNICRPVRL